MLLLINKDMRLVSAEEIYDASVINTKFWQALNHGAMMTHILCRKTAENGFQQIADFMPYIYGKLQAWQINITDLTIIEDLSETDTEKTVNFYRPIASTQSMRDPRILRLALEQAEARAFTFDKVRI